MPRRPLTQRQISARARVGRLHRINRLCARLDAAVARAESFKRGGKTRKQFEALAEQIRAELREIDH